MEERSFSVETFRPDDAVLVPRLFQEVYGDEYPVRMVYNPDEMIGALAEKNYFPFVVRLSPERIIAFGALYNSAPYKGIYEFGQGAVSPEFRSAGLGRLLFEFVAGYTPTLPGSETYFGEAVCNHTHSQKAGALIHTIETGIEVDLLPGEVYTKFQKIEGRVAVVDMFRTYVPKHHDVYLPRVYEDILRFLYAGFDDSRTIETATDEAPSAPATSFSTRVFKAAGVARIGVIRAGADFGAAFDAETGAVIDQGGIRVIQVWLNLSHRGLSPVVDKLRNRGFFFGGLFPRWFDQDGLLLQKVTGEPNWKDIQLYSERSMEILGFIKGDWSSVREIAGAK
jgi:hypothetical protein